MSAHTPGPWEHHIGLDYVAVKPTSNRATIDSVAHVYGRNQRDAVANARLISAAPDMLEALRDVRQELWVDYCLRANNSQPDPERFNSRPHIRIINDAIAKAKAEGRAS